MVELGLGCIGLGRKWGVIHTHVPSDDEVRDFLDFAFDSGVTFFDTAPAYGFSEQRLGTWLKSLTNSERDSLTVATKFGEFWDFDKDAPFRKYDFQTLKDSLDQSLEILGSIDILQLHGANQENIQDEDVLKAFDYAKSLGIPLLGASISDPSALDAATRMDLFKVIQIPHNQSKPNDIEAIHNAVSRGKLVIINRPFAMGELAQSDEFEAKVQAYEFILQDLSQGVVLTGTKSASHLDENLAAFNEAKKRFSK